VLGRKKQKRKTGQAASGDGLEPAASAPIDRKDEAPGEEGADAPPAAEAAPRIGRYTIDGRWGRAGWERCTSVTIP